MTKIKFWGVRGSVPAPLTGKDVKEKIKKFLLDNNSAISAGTDLPTLFSKLDSQKYSTYGGNTSCVELLCEDQRIILDMGTGLRPLGNSLFSEMMKNKGLNITFLLSHVHWDHIQGLPFFSPLYMNKEDGLNNSWRFYGGTDWMKTAETCFRGQMDPPTFPISWEEIKKTTHHLETYDLYDKKSFFLNDKILVKTRKLNHPQETYGWRIEYNDKVIVYTTDNEPYDPDRPDPRLLDLTKDADIWITDCQFSKDEYEGKKGPPRHGWGHSYPKAVAQTAIISNVKKVITFHHDPNHSDEEIYDIERSVEMYLSMRIDNKIKVAAAHEGLEINL